MMKMSGQNSSNAVSSTGHQPGTKKMIVDQSEKAEYPSSLAWSCILPYLSLREIEAFSQSHLKMQDIVTKYLEKGHQLVIDKHTLLKYPVSTHGYLYLLFGSWTRKLILKGAETVPLEMVFPFFPNITHLTLRGIEVQPTYTLGSYFPSLTSLSLINTTGTYKSQVLQVDPLECLYLDGNRNMPKLPSYPKLQSLTALNQTVLRFECPSLKKLTLDSCWYTVSLQTVKNLKGLELLRIIRPVGLKQKGHIDALNLKSTDYYCFDSTPTEENLILRLNDDCIRYIAKFLSTLDLTCLKHTNSRFLHLKVPHYELDEMTLKRIPFKDNIDSYKAICPLVTCLCLYSVSNDVLQILPKLTNLVDLYLASDDLLPADRNYRKWIECIPVGIKRLVLKGQVITTGPNLSTLFRKLNPTLYILDIPTTYPMDEYEDDTVPMNIGLDQLTNCQHFKCEDLGINAEFTRFATKNRYSFTHLDIGLRYHHNIWGNLHPFEYLECIKVCIDGPSTGIQLDIKERPILNYHSLPHLKELHITIDELEDYDAEEDEDESSIMVQEFMSCLDGTKLEIFHYEADPAEIPGFIFEKMTNMVDLSLKRCYFAKYGWGALSRVLLVMTKLKTLTVQDLKESEILPLIRGLQNLVELNTPGYVKYSSNTISAVRTYLREANRNLRYNDQMMP